MTIDYACEHNDVPCHEYRVTSHDGTVARVVYCDDCAALAQADWNGLTASCVPFIVDEPYDRDGTPGRACIICHCAWPASEPDTEPHHHAYECPLRVTS